MSGSRPAVVATLVAWVGAVNFSSLAQDFIVKVSSLVSGYSSPLVYLGAIIIATGVSYRYPKTIMFLSSLVVVTFYLTPLSARSAIVDSYKLVLTLVAVGFFVLAAIFLGLKRRHRRQTTLSMQGVEREIYDDIISALRSQETPLETIRDFVQDMKIIPHRTLPMTVETAASALELYRKHGGRSRLHYFDSFHVATSEQERTPLLTSDRYILDHAREIGIKTIDPRTL